MSEDSSTEAEAPGPPAKTVAASHTQTTEIVLPNDTNPHGTMFGGRLLSIMDKAAGICAGRHAGRVAVTASIDSVQFQRPLYQGDVLLVDAWINRAFTTSMEIEVIVSTESLESRKQLRANRAFFTFVAINKAGKPTPVPPLKCTTEDERLRHRQAGLRREVRLYLSNKLTLEDAPLVGDELLAVLQTKDL